MNAAEINVDPEGEMTNKNKVCCWIKNPDSLLKGSKLVAAIHVIGTIGMVAVLINTVFNMDQIYKEVSQVNVNQLPYVIKNYIFPLKNNKVAEGQEAEMKGEEPNADNIADSFFVMKLSTTKASSVSKPSKLQSKKIDKEKKWKENMRQDLFPKRNIINAGDFNHERHIFDAGNKDTRKVNNTREYYHQRYKFDGARRKRSNSKKPKMLMIGQALATNVLIGAAIFHVIHLGLCVLLFTAAYKKKWILMIPWMFSEFFRQLIFLALYGFIIYSSIPVITATRVEDNIAKFQIPFLVIILLIIVSTFVLWSVVIGALRNLYARERQIAPKSDFLRNLFIGRFKENTPTTVNTIAEAPAAPTIPKIEEMSKLPAKPVRVFEVEGHNTIHNVGHAGGIWA